LLRKPVGEMTCELSTGLPRVVVPPSSAREGGRRRKDLKAGGRGRKKEGGSPLALTHTVIFGEIP